MSRIGPLVALACLALPVGCHGPQVSRPQAPAQVRAAEDQARALASLRVLGEAPAEGRHAAPLPAYDERGAPPWLQPDDPAAPLAVLAGHWSVESVLRRRRGDELVQPRFDVRSWPLLGGRLVLEHWLAGVGPHAQRGLTLRGVEARSDTWYSLSSWPGADDVGWLWMGGVLGHGRVTWQVQDRDEFGLPIQRRRQLSDLTPVSWRLDESHSYDGGASWRLQWWREARRVVPPATPAPDVHWIDELAARADEHAAGLGAGDGSRATARAAGSAARGDSPVSRADVAAPTEPVDLASLRGAWSGTTRRQLPDGSWTSAPCTWHVFVSVQADVFAAEYVEQASDAGPGLRRVSVGVRLAGQGGRADGRPWELVRIDDRSRTPFAFSGGAPGLGALEHAGRHGVPLARLEWVVDPTSGGIGWIESSADGPAGAWQPRVEVHLERGPITP